MEHHATMTPAGPRLICQWFAACGKPTDKVAKHPTLGHVACCDDCARKLGITDRTVVEITVE
jgi:hypothetical protein